jgi:hypothetical protein
MKKFHLTAILFPALFTIAFLSCGMAQTREDIFKKETPLTWMGIDFSESRFFSDPGTVSASGMVEFYSRINYLIISEPDKYNLNKTFDKTTVTPNIDMVEKVNRSIDETKILTYNFADFNRLDTSKIQSMVSNYNTGDIKGLAAIFIMEGMNKPKELAVMWVTFFNTDTRQVLHTSRLTGKAGGMGFRNYWAATIYDVLKQIRAKEYSNWQKQVPPVK